MAGNSIRISTDQVNQIAQTIENLNNKLTDELNNSRNVVQQLSTIWQGEAAQTTIDSYNAFAEKYFQNYADVIKQYVTFLRNNVAQGYSGTEIDNIGLGETLK